MAPLLCSLGSTRFENLCKTFVIFDIPLVSYEIIVLITESKQGIFIHLQIQLSSHLHSTVSPHMNLKINKSPCFDSVLEVLCISGTSKAHASALMSPVVTLDFLRCLQWSTE